VNRIQNRGGKKKKELKGGLCGGGSRSIGLGIVFRRKGRVRTGNEEKDRISYGTRQGKKGNALKFRRKLEKRRTLKKNNLYQGSSKVGTSKLEKQKGGKG